MSGIKSFLENPYLKDKMKREGKKIGEIMSGKDDEIEGLLVEGVSKYESEKEWALGVKGEKYLNKYAYYNADGEGEPELHEEILASNYDAKTK